MSRAPARVLRAELVKLRTLPSAVWTAAGTVLVAAALAAAVAASAAEGSDAMDVLELVLPFLQIGTILLAVLAVSSEYAGRQIFASLVTTPQRMRLLAAKGLAYVIAGGLLSAGTVAAALASAAITLTVRGVEPAGDLDRWTVLGATAYLLLIGTLAFAVTVVLRQLIAPLVTMLALVMIVSPVLAAQTEHARWLPDAAGALLYRPDADALLTPATGGLVLMGWTVAVAGLGAWGFARRDA